MKVCSLPDLELEIFLKDIRAEILKNIVRVKNNSEILSFQIALALHCFTNEYLYDISDAEKRILIDLESLVEKKLSSEEQPDPEELACLASYKALYQFSWIQLAILPPQLEGLRRRQIAEPQEERNLRPQISQLKEVIDDVSLKVKGQYEQNPYPRWINLGVPLSPSPISEIAQRLDLRFVNSNIACFDSPRILIAGCGTGQQSITSAFTVQDSDVLAIDLSISSLAYAQRKTEELGISNIKYMQADILDLRELNQKFDIIESTGVLHHMEDPMAGWKVLVGCLNPGGLMNSPYIVN